MTLSETHEGSAPARAKRTRRSGKGGAAMTIVLDQSGDWMAADELRLLLLQAQQDKKAAAAGESTERIKRLPRRHGW